MKKIRAGIVGMGRIGRAHLDALRRLPEVEIVAVADRDAGGAKELAARFGVPEWYGSYTELITAVDVVHNCTPNNLHTAVNRAAIGAGKHVYAEKPLAETHADAREVYLAALRAGVLGGLNHQYRMYPAVQEMRVRVARGDVGRVFLAGGRYHQQSGLYDTDRAPSMPKGGGSWALADIGTHWVDTARCVLGKPVTRVMANMQAVHPTRVGPDGSRTETRADDLSSLLLVFEGGAQGAFTVSKVSAGHQNDFVLYVDGENYSMRWEQENPNHLYLGYKRGPNADLRFSPQLADPAVADLVPLPGGHPLGWYDALLGAVREFYAAVRGEIAASAMRCATFADGVEGVAFVEAAAESSATGRWVEPVTVNKEQ